ncbi:hypothetical protein H257_15216 [Aphanomyces astaci]|uniref:Uncharacterized protein n=1 Tax=Aphanomyces astaci TaxID=112090 RepID=W4FQ68_APHAT|nr:hypothetical protein H257_15216 [Aphanomyces astaci]ETV69081.1 hypothetical protein H257_15216 [Aphanomyces astaci]|eukprot:XP_009841540.1 hypothetical protein H257_15216 [Aphanomyces astaci]
MTLTALRRYRAVFGISPGSTSVTWSLTDATRPSTSRPKHLLWCLMFLKVYASEGVHLVPMIEHSFHWMVPTFVSGNQYCTTASGIPTNFMELGYAMKSVCACELATLSGSMEAYHAANGQIYGLHVNCFARKVYRVHVSLPCSNAANSYNYVRNVERSLHHIVRCAVLPMQEVPTPQMLKSANMPPFAGPSFS